MDESTSDACMKAAFAAILRGDYAERDRLCRKAEQLIAAEKAGNAIQRVMSVDFYVTPQGIVFSATKVLEAGGITRQ